MAGNPLKEYRRLLNSILARKGEIESELQEIKDALAQMLPPPETQMAEASVRREFPRRVRNAPSLGDAVFSVTKEAPLSKEEILAVLDRQGFQFSARATPADELASVLQLDKRFEESSGRYGPTLAALFPSE